MSEAVAETMETKETIEAAPQAADAPAEDPPEPAKRGRGRPAGSKDAAPRKKKITVRVEPIETPPPEPKAKAKPAVKPPVEKAEEPPQEEQAQEPSPPPTPRRLLRETSRHLVHLKGLVTQNRKVDMASKYTQNLMAWPAA